MESRIRALSIIFGTSEERLKEIIKERGDLYDEISKDTGLTRSEVKRWAHGAMYSIGGNLNA